ncbi:histone-lysine N-methyltransferase SETMAR-like protein [Plakobranchus ocellatus]|uniref:Histone-lysine N-methyltransferase SETMAR-like protein n=1 Tax=Plakobranchus ocellatus TaxID=259542 RepID=A0AAV4D6J8_9GAST|nr:histone-lysine N-methyltransferase SETMAR-like protein [Plakobranchus ocellatus]
MRNISERRIDNSRSERFLTACGYAGVAAVEQSLAEDRQNSCRKIAKDLLILQSSVHRVLTDKFDKKKMFSKRISYQLTTDQRDYRARFSRQFIQRLQTEQIRFPGGIVTDDETWVHPWDPETKKIDEWKDRNEPRPEKARRKQGSVKVMLNVFFNTAGFILRWPVPTGTIISILQNCYTRQIETGNKKKNDLDSCNS